MAAEEDPRRSPEEPPIIETASATTSPDNHNSGPTAYIIATVAVIVLLLLASSLSSCAASLFEYALEGGLSYSDDDDDYYYYYYDDEDPYGYDDENGDGHGNGQGTSSDGTVTVEEALALELAAYDSYLDDAISAFDYTGADSDVSDYVRSLVKADSASMDELYATMRAAAHDEDGRAEALEEACAICDEAIAALEAIEMPSVEDSGVSDSLSLGLDYELARWEALREEVTLISDAEAAGSDVDATALVEADNAVIDNTDEAGSALADAMSLSSSAH